MKIVNKPQWSVWNWILWILLFVWQLPQNIVGVILFFFRHRDNALWFMGDFIGVDDRFVSNVKNDNTHNGVSLGNFIIIEKHNSGIVAHEYGHAVQSRVLGPFYLLIIGLCSGIHAQIHSYKARKNLSRRSYYDFWTERWADKIAGIKR